VEFVAVRCLRAVTTVGVLVAHLHLCIRASNSFGRQTAHSALAYPQVPGWRLEQAEGVACLRQEWKVRPRPATFWHLQLRAR